MYKVGKNGHRFLEDNSNHKIISYEYIDKVVKPLIKWSDIKLTVLNFHSLVSIIFVEW